MLRGEVAVCGSLCHWVEGKNAKCESEQVCRAYEPEKVMEQRMRRAPTTAE